MRDRHGMLVLDDETLQSYADTSWKIGFQSWMPTRVEEHARLSLQALLKDPNIDWVRHYGARRVITELLEAKRRILPTRTTSETNNQLRWIVITLMDQLLQESIHDGNARCSGKSNPSLRNPPVWYLPALDGRVSSPCPCTIVFPYKTVRRAAAGAVRALEVANIYSITEDAVRKIYARRNRFYADYSRDTPGPKTKELVPHK